MFLVNHIVAAKSTHLHPVVYISILFIWIYILLFTLAVYLNFHRVVYISTWCVCISIWSFGLQLFLFTSLSRRLHFNFVHTHSHTFLNIIKKTSSRNPRDKRTNLPREFRDPRTFQLQFVAGVEFRLRADPPSALKDRTKRGRKKYHQGEAQRVGRGWTEACKCSRHRCLRRTSGMLESSYGGDRRP